MLVEMIVNGEKVQADIRPDMIRLLSAVLIQTSLLMTAVPTHPARPMWQVQRL